MTPDDWLAGINLAALSPLNALPWQVSRPNGSHRPAVILDHAFLHQEDGTLRITCAALEPGGRIAAYDLRQNRSGDPRAQLRIARPATPPASTGADRPWPWNSDAECALWQRLSPLNTFDWRLRHPKTLDSPFYEEQARSLTNAAKRR